MIPGFHMTNQHVFSKGYVAFLMFTAYPKKAKQEYSGTIEQQT